MVRVSIVIPLYNCLALTQATVAALAPTLPAGLTYEVILVDDGSTDGTREWLATLGAPHRTVLNPRNLGYAASNNHGARLAQGEILALLNNDLALRPGWLEPMVAALERLGARAGMIGNVQRDARSGVVDHAGLYFNAKGKPEHDRRNPGPLSRRLRPIRPVAAVTGACVLVRADLWRELGGFDEGYVNGGEDVDFCLRAAATGRINAVALRSEVGHLVSASPGRKSRDEANAYRLTQRWRDTLVRESARAWARQDFAERLRDPRDFASPWAAAAAALYLARLRRTPPAPVLAGTQVAIEIELERWRSLLGA